VFGLRTKGEECGTAVSVYAFYGEPTTGRMISTNGLRIGARPRLECFDVTFCSGALFFWIPTYLCGGVDGMGYIWFDMLYSK
jgi:hypothetical protein